jgi:CelD/BcsL family acetyltransferase involved in cellulose biosynthesis
VILPFAVDRIMERPARDAVSGTSVPMPTVFTATAGGFACHCGMPVANAITFDLITTRSDFDRLEAEWNALFEASARGIHVFQSFNWLWHWANHFLPTSAKDDGGPRLAIVTARIGGRLTLIWPLVMDQSRFIRQVSWMGWPASQYGDVLMADTPDPNGLLRTSWEFVIKALRPDVIHLPKVRSDAQVAPLLAAVGSLRSAEVEAPYLDLSSAPSFEVFEERYSAKARKNRRRLMRRLGERASLDIETYREGPEAAGLADLAVSLKRAWLRDRGQLSPTLADPRVARFLVDACAGDGRSTGARVSVLRSGGEPASIEVGFEAKGTLALHIIVYSLKFEKTGAGVLHLEEGIRRAFSDGVSTIDLLAPGADYKMDWADGVISVADHSVPLTTAGRVYTEVVIRFARSQGKALAHRLPLSLRRALS